MDTELQKFIKDLAKEYVATFNEPVGLSDGDIQDILEAKCTGNFLEYNELYKSFYDEVDKLQKDNEEEKSYGYE